METWELGAKDLWVVEDVRDLQYVLSVLRGGSAVFEVHTGARFTCSRTQSRGAPRRVWGTFYAIDEKTMRNVNVNTNSMILAYFRTELAKRRRL